MAEVRDHAGRTEARPESERRQNTASVWPVIGTNANGMLIWAESAMKAPKPNVRITSRAMALRGRMVSARV